MAPSLHTHEISLNPDFLQEICLAHRLHMYISETGAMLAWGLHICNLYTGLNLRLARILHICRICAMSNFLTYQSETYHFETYQYEKGYFVLKRTLFLTFVSLFLLLVAILLPFGLVISYRIGQNIGIISKIGNFYTNLGSFCSNFCKKCSNITHLRSNLVVIHCLKSVQFPQLPQQLQQLTHNLHLQLCLTYLLLTICILLTNMA
jgi:hypothetical protein